MSNALVSGTPFTAMERVRAYITLSKPRIMEFLLLTTVPTMVLAVRGFPNWWVLAAVLVGGVLSSASAGAFNMYLDRDMDAKMTRTLKRPLVTGVISPRQALSFAWLLAVSQAAWLIGSVGYLPAVFSTLGLLWYVAVYTMWLKRRTESNIVWGGLAGCAPILVAWCAVAPLNVWEPWILVLWLFLWTPAHYWPLSIRYADDYRAAGVPMLGATRTAVYVAWQVAAYTAATALAPFLLLVGGSVSAVFGVTAGVMGAWFVADALRMLARARSGAPLDEMRVFRTSIVYLTVVCIALAGDAAVL